jgi:hypothetical protein
MAISSVPSILPRPQIVADGVILLTQPQILWEARPTEARAGDEK